MVRVRATATATATATARVWGGLYAVWPRLEASHRWISREGVRWISPDGVRWVPPHGGGCGTATCAAPPGVHRSLVRGRGRARGRLRVRLRIRVRVVDGTLVRVRIS